MAMVLDLLTLTLSMRSTIYELDNASLSNDVTVAKLDWSKCAILYADFNTSAVRFTTGIPHKCESLDLEWTINPMYEPVFLYARKRRSSYHFRANGGVRVHAKTQENYKNPRIEKY
ncbi:hypothetical protein DPMN_136581 [Dreissena polymorpha]|uniref:Uncharacterized protein n=1 Tax=Dreissena polymorpha TaxID=45954 RepID=A0A9D4G3V9_DREPO|nr:hypothetical protein DPMN_136581 [Dreissena polymorpha]